MNPMSISSQAYPLISACSKANIVHVIDTWSDTNVWNPVISTTIEGDQIHS